MDFSSQIIFLVAVVLLGSILSSVVTSRLGVPLLLVFLGIGMLLGPEGPGGVSFENITLAHLIGSAALAIILFDGGMRTPARNFRIGLKPAVGLATVGVLITSGLTGLFAVWWLGLSWLEGLLLGAIVGSTDAAAVFSLLRSRGLELKSRVGATLEIESGSNDPMAIFLTIVLIELILMDQPDFGVVVLVEFVQQMGLGALLGVGGGLALLALINRVPMSAGFYPLFALAGALAIFGLTGMVGGSGFLAVYLAGLLLGNRPLEASQNIKRFHDGIAALAQIGMFLMLGMIVTPSELPPVALDAGLVALVLILLARPLAVALCLYPFRFPWREQLFIAWVGLRGAVPIILALFPLLAGLELAEYFFHVVFFVVLISLMVQGWTVASSARWLGLELPPTTTRVQRTELDIPGQQEMELVGYRLAETTPVVREAWSGFRLPGSARVVAHLREGQLLETLELLDLQAGDHLYIMVAPADLPDLDRLFVPQEEVPERLTERSVFGEFALNGDALLGAVGMTYGAPVPSERQGETLEAFLRAELQTEPVVGDFVDLGPTRLVVREMEGARITRVGLKLLKKE
ncbi:MULTISPECIES: potassium/proton antiporter [unclassified Thioalkalivibrio]|uniref:potassium/proton antiporter n=1 Tax=unclassified Thioalkalivibrio TaxID=2621013 RepID=UPI00037EACC2|nr:MULTISPECIES: potassium/proton antiporter [unclassified Thioalkalivibrio]